MVDPQRIHNLIEYLEELHDHHKATSDHTTLLLNCYAKLKDVEKLEEFIKSPDDLKFDLDTAILMCRQGGYYDQAAFLARKHGEHELVVDVLHKAVYAFVTGFVAVGVLVAHRHRRDLVQPVGVVHPAVGGLDLDVRRRQPGQLDLRPQRQARTPETSDPRRML